MIGNEDDRARLKKMIECWLHAVDTGQVVDIDGKTEPMAPGLRYGSRLVLSDSTEIELRLVWRDKYDAYRHRVGKDQSC